RQRQRQAAMRLESMLSTAYAALAGAHDQASALHARAIPAASDAYQVTRQAFDAGELPFLDVLDAQRTLFELETRYVDALAGYHTAVDKIESLTGYRLAEMDQVQHQSAEEIQP